MYRGPLIALHDVCYRLNVCVGGGGACVRACVCVRAT